MSARDVVEVLAIILAAGLASELVAAFLRLPRMVVLLAAGLLLGPDVLDLLDVPLDALGVQLLVTLGVSFILFYGGLKISLRVLSRVGIGLTLLALPGVVLTALVVGVAAMWAFGLPFDVAFLIGAVVAPTDPAILIPLFERLRVRERVSQTVIAESALNDATGAVLALSVAAFVVADDGAFGEPLVEFVQELAVSLVLGVAFGLALALVLSAGRTGIWRESPALAVAAVVAASSVSIDSAGGSGYMGAFVAGLVVGNAGPLRLPRTEWHERELKLIVERLTDIVVLFVFVVVGANLPLEAMGDNAAPALLVIAALILVARPLTVLAALLPDRRARWERGELAFIAWTRETGIVPVALVGLLAAEGVPAQEELVTVVAFAIVVTLALQSTTKAWLARRLGLSDPTERPPVPAAAAPDAVSRARV